MKKSSGLFFITAALIMSVIIWGNPLRPIVTALTPDISTGISQSSLTVTETVSRPPIIDTAVDDTQLMAHLNEIAYPRHSSTEKETLRIYLTRQLATYGLTPTAQTYGSPSAGGTNLVVDIPGNNAVSPTSARTPTLILGAHYDTVPGSPGADDNGSAIATLLEAARIFSPQNRAVSLNTNLKIVFFDQEERQVDGSGLLGSSTFVTNTQNTTDITGAVILDMIGYACNAPGCQTYPQSLPMVNLPDTGNFLAVIGRASDTALIEAFVKSAQTDWPMVLSLPVPAATLQLFPDLLRSDHAPFWEQDIPALLVTDTGNFRNPGYHTAQDLPDKLDLRFFKGSAQHVINAISTLVQAEA